MSQEQRLEDKIKQQQDRQTYHGKDITKIPVSIHVSGGRRLKAVYREVERRIKGADTHPAEYGP